MKGYKTSPAFCNSLSNVVLIKKSFKEGQQQQCKEILKSLTFDTFDTVDGRNHQLVGGKHPIIYRLSTIPGGARFLPSTGPQNLSEFTKNS
jgi:hypothetical protein